MYYIEIDIEADPEIAEAAGVAGTPTLQVGNDLGVRSERSVMCVCGCNNNS